MEEIGILHEDESMKKTFPAINVVTRQTANLKRKIMRNRYLSDNGEERNTTLPLPPPGNFRRHDLSRCVQMESGK